MDTLRDLLVHVNDEIASAKAMEMAALLAAATGARLTVVATGSPVLPWAGLGAETVAFARAAEQAQRETLHTVVARLVGAHARSVTAPVEVHVVADDAAEVLAAHARTSDLVIVAQRDPDADGGLGPVQAGRLLVGVGRPVLVVPYIGAFGGASAPPASAVLRRILVAWADTRETVRAVHDALPLLARASHVELVSFAGGPHDVPSRRAALDGVAAHLARHGVRAQVSVAAHGEPTSGARRRQGWQPDVAVSEALLSHAADMQADLIVMGAYGHSRLRELVLGGVTRALLGAMTVPVLMSH